MLDREGPFAYKNETKDLLAKLSRKRAPKDKDAGDASKPSPNRPAKPERQPLRMPPRPSPPTAEEGPREGGQELKRSWQCDPSRCHDLYPEAGPTCVPPSRWVYTRCIVAKGKSSGAFLSKLPGDARLPGDTQKAAIAAFSVKPPPLFDLPAAAKKMKNGRVLSQEPARPHRTWPPGSLPANQATRVFVRISQFAYSVGRNRRSVRADGPGASGAGFTGSGAGVGVKLGPMLFGSGVP